MLQLLQLLFDQKLLSKRSNDFLISIMTEIPGWSKRITALLPPDTKLIHKTGSSGINEQVFASDYKGPRDRGEHIIATISKQIWDYYTQK